MNKAGLTPDGLALSEGYERTMKDVVLPALAARRTDLTVKGDGGRPLFCRRYDAEGLFAPGNAEAYCDEIARDAFKRPVAELPADKVRLVSLTLAARAAAKRNSRRIAQNRAEGGGRENVRPGGAAR